MIKAYIDFKSLECFLAIEPMINLGTHRVRQLNDGWSIITGDKKPSAHFEHDVVVRQGKADVLSSFKDIEEVLNSKNTN